MSYRNQSYRNEICGANQWTGFYMISASVMKGLRNGMSVFKHKTLTATANEVLTVALLCQIDCLWI